MRHTYVKIGIAMAVLLAISGTRVYAQAAPTTLIITDQSKLAWTPSTDDNATFGTPPLPLVTSYRAELYLKSNVTMTTAAGVTTFTPTGTPAITLDEGKPVPDATNTEVGPIALKSVVQPNVEYVAFLRALGSGGISPLSNGVGPFGFPGLPKAPVNLRIIP